MHQSRRRKDIFSAGYTCGHVIAVDGADNFIPNGTYHSTRLNQRRAANSA